MGCGCRGSGAATPRAEPDIRKVQAGDWRTRPTDPMAPDSQWRGRPVIEKQPVETGRT